MDWMPLRVRKHKATIRRISTLTSTDWNDKNQVIEAMRNYGDELLKVNEKLRNDPDVVLAAVRNSGIALSLASSELQNNFEIVRESVKNCASSYFHASKELQHNRDIILCTVSSDGEMIQHVPEDDKNDEFVVLVAIRSNPKAVEHVSEFYRTNRDFVLKGVALRCSQKESYFTYISERLQRDREVVLTATHHDLPFEGFLDDFEVMDAVFSNKENSKENLLPLSDRSVIIQLIPKYAKVIPHISAELLSDKRFVMQILHLYGENEIPPFYDYYRRYVIQSNIKDDEDVILYAIENFRGFRLKRASKRLRDTEKIVRLAVLKRQLNMKYASPRLRQSWEFVFPLLKENPALYEHCDLVLQFCKNYDPEVLSVISKCKIKDADVAHIPMEHRNDESFMTAALPNCAVLLRGSELRYNKDFVEKAAKLNGLALEFIPAELVKRKMILDAVRNNVNAIRFLQETPDKEIIMAAFENEELVRHILSTEDYEYDSPLQEFVPQCLYNDKEVVMRILRAYDCVDMITPTLLQDKDIIELALQHPSTIEKFPECVRNDREAVLLALSTCETALSVTSTELKHDVQLLVQAYEKLGDRIFSTIDDEMKYNKELAKAFLITGEYKGCFFDPLTELSVFQSQSQKQKSARK